MRSLKNGRDNIESQKFRSGHEIFITKIYFNTNLERFNKLFGPCKFGTIQYSVCKIKYMNDLRKLTFIHIAVVHVCEREIFKF